MTDKTLQLFICTPDNTTYLLQCSNNATIFSLIKTIAEKMQITPAVFMNHYWVACNARTFSFSLGMTLDTFGIHNEDTIRIRQRLYPKYQVDYTLFNPSIRDTITIITPSLNYAIKSPMLLFAISAFLNLIFAEDSSASLTVTSIPNKIFK